MAVGNPLQRRLCEHIFAAGGVISVSLAHENTLRGTCVCVQRDYACDVPPSTHKLFTATATADGWRVEGQASFVAGDFAAALLVRAVTSSSRDGRGLGFVNHETIFLLPAAQLAETGALRVLRTTRDAVTTVSR
uniref:Uncharacterized protein n=1 Tax=Lygus hesperus TaxID=30085 RepID=A0A146LV56_LYGHE